MTTAAFAEPDISGVSGNYIHDGSITINGSSFGIKSPAAPLVWDDCTSSPSLSTYYDETLPSNAQQGSEYNMAYRGVPFRGIDAPNDRISYILGGAHATNTHAGQYYSGNNVSVGKNLSSFQFFAQYWYRIDLLFDEENHPTYGENLKELSLSETENQIYGGDWGYYSWCGSHTPHINYTDPVRLNRVPIDCPSSPYSCSSDDYVVTHSNPINDWVKMQWVGGYNSTYDNPTVRFTTYPDGHVTYQSHYGGEITTYETTCGCGYPDSGQLKFLGLGGFSRVPKLNNGTNAFRYFAGIYIDDTYSRVMLGDNSDYDSCTKMEPQIPSAWSDDSIIVTANLGSFTGSGTAYLFVFDSDNNHNPTGFPVTLGSGSSGDSVSPTTSGHSPLKGSIGFHANSSIIVHIQDSGDGVDQSTIVMTVNGQTVNPVIEGSPSDYTITYNPTTPFNAGETIAVTISAQDLHNPPNVMATESYTFTVSELRLLEQQ